jgi:hypothetical protein
MAKSNLRIFIQTPEENAKGSGVGQWLTLPASAGKLVELLTQIGADTEHMPPYAISSIKSPLPGVRDALFLSSSLDELNMIAHYLKGMEPYEIDSLQAILRTGIMAEGRGAAALINLMHADNLDAFNIIDASDAAALGAYWAREVLDAIPEGMTPEEYGKMCVAEEKGIFTEWGYVYKRMELTQEYAGVVPEEYRITEAALRSIRPVVVVPIYPYSFDIAVQRGEMDGYHKSYAANVACAQTIDKAVNASNHDTYRYDMNAAAKTVIEQFGFDRMN